MKPDAYWEGFRAKSILDNPHWKDYPQNPLSDEATKSRHFVDGWLAARREEKDVRHAYPKL